MGSKERGLQSVISNEAIAVHKGASETAWNISDIYVGAFLVQKQKINTLFKVFVTSIK